MDLKITGSDSSFATLLCDFWGVSYMSLDLIFHLCKIGKSVESTKKGP